MMMMRWALLEAIEESIGQPDSQDQLLNTLAGSRSLIDLLAGRMIEAGVEVASRGDASLPDDLIDETTAAEELKISPSKLRQWAVAGVPDSPPHFVISASGSKRVVRRYSIRHLSTWLQRKQYGYTVVTAVVESDNGEYTASLACDDLYAACLKVSIEEGRAPLDPVLKILANISGTGTAWLMAKGRSNPILLSIIRHDQTPISALSRLQIPLEVRHSDHNLPTLRCVAELSIGSEFAA